MSELAYKQVNIGTVLGYMKELVVVSELTYKQVNIGYFPGLHEEAGRCVRTSLQTSKHRLLSCVT